MSELHETRDELIAFHVFQADDVLMLLGSEDSGVTEVTADAFISASMPLLEWFDDPDIAISAQLLMRREAAQILSSPFGAMTIQEVNSYLLGLVAGVMLFAPDTPVSFNRAKNLIHRTIQASGDRRCHLAGFMAGRDIRGKDYDCMLDDEVQNFLKHHE